VTQPWLDGVRRSAKHAVASALPKLTAGIKDDASRPTEKILA
jgi:hypothetical protein